MQVAGNVREGHITLNLERSEQAGLSAKWLGAFAWGDVKWLTQEIDIINDVVHYKSAYYGTIMVGSPQWPKCADLWANLSPGQSHLRWFSTLAAGI